MVSQGIVTNIPDFDTDQVDVEVLVPKAPDSEFSVARRAALQVLYEVDSSDHPVKLVIAQRIEAGEISKRAVRYLRRLVFGILENQEQLDGVIRHYAPEWPLQQLALVDRNILRIATFELTIQSSTPVAVVIDEALGLADLFGSEAAPRFINGVLGSLVDDQPLAQEAVVSEDAETLE